MDRARALPRSSEGPARLRRPAAGSTRDRPADRSSASPAIQEASCYFAWAERVPSKTLRRREHAHRAARVWGQWARTIQGKFQGFGEVRSISFEPGPTVTSGQQNAMPRGRSRASYLCPEHHIYKEGKRAESRTGKARARKS